MIESYPAKYQDESGEEVTSISNDGKTLQMVVREIRFIGSDFDGLKPVVKGNPDSLNSFVIHCGCLCDCIIEWEMPIPIVVDERVSHGTLHARLKLGKPRPHDCSIDEEALQLSLHYKDKSFFSCGKHGWFDDELEEIKAQLPDEMYLKVCHRCAFGHYPAAGYGLFGGLACFRNQKDEAREAKYKTAAYWQLFETGVTEWVQETYLCPEFERRKA